jgi:hypothetical protein
MKDTFGNDLFIDDFVSAYNFYGNVIQINSKKVLIKNPKDNKQLELIPVKMGSYYYIDCIKINEYYQKYLMLDIEFPKEEKTFWQKIKDIFKNVR